MKSSLTIVVRVPYGTLFFPWSGPWGPDFSDNCVYIQRQGQSAPSGQIKEEEMGSAACSPHPKGVSAMEQLEAKGHFFFPENGRVAIFLLLCNRSGIRRMKVTHTKSLFRRNGNAAIDRGLSSAVIIYLVPFKAEKMDLVVRTLMSRVLSMELGRKSVFVRMRSDRSSSAFHW